MEVSIGNYYRYFLEEVSYGFSYVYISIKKNLQIYMNMSLEIFVLRSFRINGGYETLAFHVDSRLRNRSLYHNQGFSYRKIAQEICKR